MSASSSWAGAQAATNLAEGKPLGDGVLLAAGIGGVTGALGAPGVGRVIGKVAGRAGSGVGKLASKVVRGGTVIASPKGGIIRRMKIERMIAKGEKIADLIDEAKHATYTQAKEFGIVSLKRGGRAMVSGGPGGIRLPQTGQNAVKRYLFHVHPHGYTTSGFAGASHIPGPSGADMTALAQLNQTRSYV